MLRRGGRLAGAYAQRWFKSMRIEPETLPAAEADCSWSTAARDVLGCGRAGVVLDRLADALFAADEILGILRREDAETLPAEWLASIEPNVSRIYDRVNDLMKRLSS